MEGDPKLSRARRSLHPSCSIRYIACTVGRCSARHPRVVHICTYLPWSWCDGRGRMADERSYLESSAHRRVAGRSKLRTVGARVRCTTTSRVMPAVLIVPLKASTSLQGQTLQTFAGGGQFGRPSPLDSRQTSTLLCTYVWSRLARPCMGVQGWLGVNTSSMVVASKSIIIVIIIILRTQLHYSLFQITIVSRFHRMDRCVHTVQRVFQL